ncbi:hypothetical protein DFJ74DRAFT_642719 [Hyaloraphidium curvatum]|nr:hypothetical protein DFJ74DRAFT_642719 [Hyaloraphidium curvatum]
MSTFIELGSRYPELIAERRRVIETNPTDVTFMLECAREASLEYLHYIADYITQRFPTCFEKINGGKGILNKVTGESWPDLDAVPEPMKVVGSLIIEDVAILTKHKTDAHPDDDVNWKYNSSINCYSFPGSLMTTKIGTVMGVVHEPVPGFNAKILKPVNKWFDVLQNPSHRLNWFIQKDPRYFRPEYVGNMVDMNEPERPPTFEELYLRVERQTFIRLPKTKAVVFGIRLFVYKLTDVIADMEEREKTEVPKGNPDDPDPDKRPLRPFVERLYSAVCRMGPDFSKYKNMVALNPIVKQWLEDHKGMSEKYIEAS